MHLKFHTIHCIMKGVFFNSGSSITLVAIAKCCPKIIIDIIDANWSTYVTIYSILFSRHCLMDLLMMLIIEMCCYLNKILDYNLICNRKSHNFWTMSNKKILLRNLEFMSSTYRIESFVKPNLGSVH